MHWRGYLFHVLSAQQDSSLPTLVATEHAVFFCVHRPKAN